MSLLVFPNDLPGLTFPVDKTSKFSTIVQSAPNLLETTVSQARNPCWEWTLIYNMLDDEEGSDLGLARVTGYRRLQGFILAAAGSGGEFLLDDVTDDSVGPGVVSGSPNTPMAELQIVDDGAGIYYSPVQRNFGGYFLEDISDLNGSIAVYDNGSLKTLGTDYTLLGPGVSFNGYSFRGLVIQWASEPTGPVTATFKFYFRVRFSEDSQDFSRFVGDMWTVGGDDAGNSVSLILKSSPPVQV